MSNEISAMKEMLLSNPDKIIELLELFSFEHIIRKPSEIRCSRDSHGGANISIRLEKNEFLYVSDWSRSVHIDFFGYIAQEKNVKLREVFLETKRVLGLANDWTVKPRYQLFGGIYANIHKKPEDLPIQTYSEDVLNSYIQCGCQKWLPDITLETQRKFGICYNIITQRIGIPIRNLVGDLCGIKARRNYETDDENDPKYIFELPCQKSRILYGAFENYQYLTNANRILIGEGEKLTLACDSYHWNSAVSIMGNTLSDEQAKILLSFNAKEYCFMLDEGLDLSVTFNNIKKLKEIGRMKSFKCSYWDYNLSLISNKSNPSDFGKEEFYSILNSDEIVEVK